MNTFKIFIDGSCLNIGKPNAIAGWAFAVIDSNNKCIINKYGKIRRGTQDSNRAELEALLQAVKYIKKNKDTNFIIYSDSEVLVHGVQGQASRNSNRDIWEEIEHICYEIVGRLDIEHIRSHQKDECPHVEYNNYVDKLAKQGANSLLIAPIK